MRVGRQRLPGHGEVGVPGASREAPALEPHGGEHRREGGRAQCQRAVLDPVAQLLGEGGGGAVGGEIAIRSTPAAASIASSSEAL